MVGDQVKSLREARSWSQQHLADASGLNVRTIQRIEQGERCSDETLLSLAATFDVDVSELEAQHPFSNHRGKGAQSRLAAAALLALPSAMFVSVNLLRSLVGVDVPYDLLATTGGKLMSFRTFNLISPVVFIGGAAAALILSMSTVVRLRTRIDENVIKLTAVEFKAKPLALGLALAATLSAGAILVYAIVEQLRTIAP
jgi:transcriptional regulator with XRE-family HTH domain